MNTDGRAHYNKRIDSAMDWLQIQVNIVVSLLPKYDNQEWGHSLRNVHQQNDKEAAVGSNFKDE